MANPVQFRKCEELFGSRDLPEKQGPAARLARNPVWVFLKGLEGFDTERANECMVKLLNNHYDTIGVLKLASKRDLVEDAGILPGDALRIVAAAKDYVAPRESNPEAISHCDQANKPVLGGELRQGAYRPPALRETTVMFTPLAASQSSSHAHSLPVTQRPNIVNHGAALPSQQEAVKEAKVVNQFAPKQETVKVAKAPVLPPPRGAFVDGKLAYSPADSRFVSEADPTLPPPWRALVDGKTGRVYYWNPVMNLTQYEKPLSAVGSGPTFPNGSPPLGPPPPSATPAPNAAIPQTVPSPNSYPHTCRLCKVTCDSEDQARTHYNGQRHNKAFKKVQNSAQIAKAVDKTVDKTVKETKAADPQILWELKLPFQQSEQGASGSKQPSSSLPIAEALHACGVCLVKCGSETVLRSHFNGKKHAKKLEQATEAKDNRPTPYLYCSICDVTSMCKRNLVMHFSGKKHANKMKEDSDSEDSSYYSDSENE